MSYLKHIRIIAPLLVCVVAVTIVATSHGFLAHASGAPTLVSGPSPYAGCSNGTQTGTNYVNAEVEPYVAVNPTNPKNIIGVWQQDRWSNGGSHGLVAGYSFDGGKTWGETPQPFSQCAPGGLPYERASDPWVSFGPDGTAYSVSISFNNTNNKNAVGAATSTDGGKTWGNLQTLVSYTTNGGQLSTDKESVTADPVKAGTAYAVWDTLVSPTDQPDDKPHTHAFTGDAYFSKTTDGGKTWSAPSVMVHTAQNTQTIGNQIVIDPRTGTLYDFLDLILQPTSKGYNVAFVKSTDGGSTWTQPQIISTLGTAFVTDPNTGQAIRTGDIIPEAAIDPQSGQLYAVWQDARFTDGKTDEVAISTSSNGGSTWSTPVRVNTNTPANRPGFNPTVRVNSAGTVGVSFYDFRNLTTETTTLPTDYWLVTSTNHGASFGNETHVSGSFDMLTAPVTGSGYFIGDYEGLNAIGSILEPFFSQTNSGNLTNRTDIFSFFN